MNTKRIILIVSWILTCLLGTSNAQKNIGDVSAAKRVTFYSKILNEEITLLVNLPSDYFTSDKKYPLIIHIDGEERTFIKRMGEAYRLQDEGGMPEVITVAAVSNDRNRDIFPFKTLYHRTSGGGDNFIKFISQELIPFLTSNYRTTGHRTLVGFSGSALIVCYYMLTNPFDFNAFLLVSPSLAFDLPFFGKLMNDFTNKYSSLNKTLAVVFGSAEGAGFYGEQSYYDAKGTIEMIIKAFNNKSPRNFNWSMTIIPGGAHVSENAVYEGLKKIFAGYIKPGIPEIIPDGGFYSFDKKLQLSSNGEPQNIFYTTDGTIPGLTAHKMGDKIGLDEGSILKLRYFDSLSGSSNIKEIKIIKSEYFKPVKIKEALVSGVKYEYYENYYYRSLLPDFAAEKMINEGITGTIDISKKQRFEGFAFIFEGFIKAEEKGNYLFYIKANDEAKMFIDDKEIIYKNREYSYSEKSGIVPLEKGYHKIKVLYVGPPFKNKLFLNISYGMEGGGKKELTPDMLYTTK
jgi:predicted alpha/beta superfamily hydrolase